RLREAAQHHHSRALRHPRHPHHSRTHSAGSDRRSDLHVRPRLEPIRRWRDVAGGFTQMAFSTGAGWALYLTYSVYVDKREDKSLNASVVVAGNLFASLLAGMAVMGTVFA